MKAIRGRLRNGSAGLVRPIVSGQRRVPKPAASIIADPDWADPDWADPDWADPDWADPDWADPGWADPGWPDPGGPEVGEVVRGLVIEKIRARVQLSPNITAGKQPSLDPRKLPGWATRRGYLARLPGQPDSPD